MSFSKRDEDDLTRRELLVAGVSELVGAMPKNLSGRDEIVIHRYIIQGRDFCCKNGVGVW